MMLRLMTYNIRACLGLDGVRSPERIANVIRASEPDVVALQEVDFGRARSGGIDQAEAIARQLGMRFLAGASLHDDDGGTYGNAVLARVPIVRVQHDALPQRAGSEPRSAMWVRLHSAFGDVDLINTHLSFRRRERARQVEHLAGPDWLGGRRAGRRLILCGDLNCSQRAFRPIRRHLTDVYAGLRRIPPATWPTRRPWRRLDHILISAALRASAVHSARTQESRLASDHYPVVADLGPRTPPPEPSEAPS